MRRFWGESQSYFLLSVAIAVVMWLYVATAQNPVVARQMRVELQLRNLPANEVLIRPSSSVPVQVTVRLQGQRAQIALLSPALVDAYVDLSGLGPGDHPNVPVVVSPRLDVRVMDEKPSSILVVLDAFSSKRLPVEVSLLGKPAQGVMLGSPHTAPARVLVSGPAQQVSEVRHAVVSIDTGPLRQQVVASLPVVATDASGQPVPSVQVSPKIVDLTLPVREGIISKVVAIVPTITGTPSPSLTVSSATAEPETVALTGPTSALAGVESAATTPVDISAARADITRRVPLQLPVGVSASVEQATVTVRFGRGRLSTVFHSVPIRVVGIRSGQTSRVVPDHVDLQVEGPQDLVRRLIAQGVSGVLVEVSAAGRQPGRYAVSPQPVLPKGIRVLNIQPQQVLVILSST
jgi:YbbR domain-containing protein